MKILDLIKQYREKLNNKPNDISCLLFALQIPSICSRIEFSRTDYVELYDNGKPKDGKMYKAWLCKYSSCFKTIYMSSMNLNCFCDNIYKLRCNFVHEGVLMDDKNTKFYFVESDSSMSINDIIFISIGNFCECMFDAAERSFLNTGASKKVSMFADILIPSNIYSNIYNNTVLLYCEFWDKYRPSDISLNIIYQYMESGSNDFEQLKRDIKYYFLNNPDEKYELPYFNRKFNCWTLHNEYIDESGTLSLFKSDYERMLQIHKELDDFSKEHPFDINKYTN